MWERILLAILVVVFWCAVYFVDEFFRFKVKRYTVQLCPFVGLSLFFLVFMALIVPSSAYGDVEIMGRSLMLSMAIGIPFSFYLKRSVDKRIEGRAVYRKIGPFPSFRGIAVFVPLLVIPFVTDVAVEFDFWKWFRDSAWPALGLASGSFIGSLFIVLYIIALERKLGGPILGHER